MPFRRPCFGLLPRAAHIWTAALMLVGLASTQALTNEYPSKPLKILVATAPGGPTDTVARLIANYITEKVGATAIIENRPGAGGTLAGATLAKAEPDGYTVGFAAAGEIVIHPYLYKNLSHDPQKDLVPVALVAEAPQVLAITAQIPPTNLREFIAYAKANPGKVNYGSAGTGGTPHLGALQFAKLAGLELTHVPYRGAALAATDLIAGRIQMLHISPLAVVEHARTGKVRILAITQSTRSSRMPDVPTSAEAGLPGYEASVWFGLFAPRGTPKPIINKLNSIIADMAKDPTYRDRMGATFYEPATMSPEEFAAKIAREAPEWERAVKDSGISIQ